MRLTNQRINFIRSLREESVKAHIWLEEFCNGNFNISAQQCEITSQYVSENMRNSWIDEKRDA